ncbi:MAG: DUF1573 domain-containing protein [Planctomycetia bacterium]
MKFWITATLGIIVIAGLSTAVYVANPESRLQKPKPTASTAPAEPMPKAVALKSQDSIGDLQQNQKGKSTYEIRNDGKAVLELKNGKTNCGCVAINVAAASLEPGATTTVTLDWDTKERMGEYTANGEIDTHAPENPKLAFSAKLTVVADVVMTPPALRLGVLNEAEGATQSLFVTSVLHDNLEIKNFQSSSPGVEAVAKPMTAEKLAEMKVKSGHEVVVTVKPYRPVGGFSEKIVFNTSLERTPELTMSVSGQVEGRIQIAPNRIDFAPAAGGSLAEQTLRIFAKGMAANETLKLGEVEPSFLKVKLEKSPEFKVLWLLTAAVDPAAPLGGFEGSISILDGTGQKRLNVPVRGIVQRGSAATAATAASPTAAR